jgi:hypothetical protein
VSREIRNLQKKLAISDSLGILGSWAESDDPTLELSDTGLIVQWANFQDSSCCLETLKSVQYLKAYDDLLYLEGLGY